jgi:hypothetical protein
LQKAAAAAPCKWPIAPSSGLIIVPPEQGGLKTRLLAASAADFSTKIHARTNAHGLSIALILTPCEALDSAAFNDLMTGHDANPEVMLADKG